MSFYKCEFCHDFFDDGDIYLQHVEMGEGEELRGDIVCPRCERHLEPEEWQEVDESDLVEEARSLRKELEEAQAEAAKNEVERYKQHAKEEMAR